MHNVLKIIFLCAFTIASEATAGDLSCIGTGDYKSASIFLIDGSDSSALNESFDVSLKTVLESLTPKERAIVAIITERRATVKVLLDLVKPEESIWESKLLYQKKSKEFSGCVQKVSAIAREEVLRKHDKTAILETLLFAKEVFSGTQGAKRLFIYSDMIQNSDAITFYHLGSKETEASLLKKVSNEKLIVDLKTVSVKVAGVGGAQTDKAARTVEAFWREYFSQAGASLEFYGPVLLR